MTSHPELACYLLAGQPKSPRDILDEVRGAERLGLGTAFISERYHSKEADGAVRRGGLGHRVGFASPPPPPITTRATRWSPPAQRSPCTGSRAGASCSGSAAASS